MRWLVAVACLSLVLSGCASKSSESDTSSDSDSGTASKAQTAGASTSKAPTSGTATGSKAPSGTATGTAATSSNKAPAITAFAANVTGLNATFTLAATDANNDTLSYTLSFGDGSVNATGSLPAANVTYAFAAAGNYTAQLIVSDGKLSANQTILIVVVAPPAVVLSTQCERTPTAELPGALYVFEGDNGNWVFAETNDKPGLQVENNHPLDSIPDAGEHNVAWEGCTDGDQMMF
ncbi:MAG: PKD domain-containing protein [Candidatus Thermoplasmatota archaeon]